MFIPLCHPILEITAGFSGNPTPQTLTSVDQPCSLEVPTSLPCGSWLLREDIVPREGDRVEPSLLFAERRTQQSWALGQREVAGGQEAGIYWALTVCLAPCQTLYLHKLI